MDKGYSGLNPHKSNHTSFGILGVHDVEEMRIHENAVVVDVEDIVSEQVEKATKGHPYSRPKYAPIKIPFNVAVKKYNKNGYEQVKYTWRHGQFRYEVRWHESTPNSPDKKQSWVVARIKNGSKSTNRVIMIRSGNKWIPFNAWQAAIAAKKKGNATKAQMKLLDKGHFTRRRGK